MAVLMNGQIHYQDIIGGKHKVGTRVASPIIPEYEQISNFRDTTLVQPGKIRGLPLLGTQKRQTVLAVSIDPVLGMVVPTDTQDGTRKYAILPGQIHGNRKQRLSNTDMLTVDQERGQRIAKVLTGVGAFGIGYNPQPTTPDAKPIRKYPRDWHGENMH